MEDNLSDLMSNGYMIYPSDGAFLVRKMPVPGNQRAVDPVRARNHEEAVALAMSLHRQPVSSVWSLTARYNRGLGVEYRNLPEVTASSHEEALRKGEELAVVVLGKNSCVAEVRARWKSDC